MDASIDNQYQIIEGTVIDTRINKDLHVHGSIGGGGGSVRTDSFGNVSGSTSPVSGNISSTTVESQELWVKTYNGKEIHINLGTNIISLRTRLASSSISLRAGHEIALLYKDGELMCLYIKNTEELFQISDRFQMSDEPIYDPGNASISPYMCVPFAVIGILLMFYSFWVGVVLIILSIIFRMIIPKINQNGEKLRKEIEEKWIQDKEKWTQDKEMRDKAIDTLRNTKLLNG